MKLFFLLLLAVYAKGSVPISDELKAKAEAILAAGPPNVVNWLKDFSSDANARTNVDVTAQWTFYTNTTDYNSNQSAIADSVLANWMHDEGQLAAYIYPKTAQNAFTASQQRRLKKITDLGIFLNKTGTQQLATYVNYMTSFYANQTLCAWVGPGPNATNCSVQWQLDPDIFNVLASSQNYDELAYVWNAWRAKNAALKPTWLKFMKLSNQGAQAGGYNDTGAYWRSWYELPAGQFPKTVQNLYYQILPMYETLHTYVRRQMKAKYPNRWSDSTMPAHILGNMWAQEWQNIAGMTQPYPNAGILDVTKTMKAQGYNASKMFHTADHFFTSLGLGAMVPNFWKNSIIVKPNRKPVNFVCHASAWDFYTGNDFRIKMCTSVDMNNLITIHHEMGHIQYYMQYSHQPNVFRNGANPGFHEAIGDTIALSAGTPQHLKKIGLLPANFTISAQQDMNFLYSQALEKVAFLPWGYLMDLWRWNVFNGQYNASQMNQYWWNLRYQLQGLSAPVARPANAFDPASKSHIDDNTPYIRYFVSFIVQFQFYQSMCQAAGYNASTPLHQCDFYNQTKAGDLLKGMLSMGASQPWPAAMQKMTGQNAMNASAINTYFAPLITELKNRNKANCDCYGWGNDAAYPTSVLNSLPKPRCPAKGNAWPGTCKAPTKKPPAGAASSLNNSLQFLLLLPLSLSIVLKKLL